MEEVVDSEEGCVRRVVQEERPGRHNESPGKFWWREGELKWAFEGSLAAAAGAGRPRRWRDATTTTMNSVLASAAAAVVVEQASSADADADESVLASERDLPRMGLRVKQRRSSTQNLADRRLPGAVRRPILGIALRLWGQRCSKVEV